MSKPYLTLNRRFVLLIALLCVGMTYGQRKTISGTVLSDTGDPLPGVTVIALDVKSVGTATDFDGNFQLKVPEKVVNIEISYMGFETQTISIDGKTSLTVNLIAASNELEEVVVVGFGTQKRKDITGAIASVKAEELDRTINMNVGDALQGKVAGLQVLSEDGTPGGGFKVNIRGASSITGSTEPLYVVDGFPIEVFGNDIDSSNGYEGGTSSSPIDFLDASLIESIEILKDASATAIYGARGANGVVIITTKQGKAGKTKITYSVSSSLSSVPTERLPSMQNTAEVFDYLTSKDYYDLGVNRFRVGDTEEWEYTLPREDFTLEDPYYTGDEDTPKLNREQWNDQLSDTNWIEEVMRTGVVTNHVLGISGGSERNTYNYSMSYLNNEGVVVGSGYDRFVLNVNLKNKFTDKLTLNTNISPTYSKSFGTGGGGSSVRNSWGFFSRTLNTPPYTQFSDTSIGNDGFDDTDESYYNNPLYQAENEVNNNTKYGIRMLSKVSYEIFKGLRANIDFGIKFDRQEQRQYNPPTFAIGANNRVQGQATRLDKQQVAYTNSNVLNYVTAFGDHRFNATLGYTQQSKDTDSYRHRANHFDISVEDGSVDFDKAGVYSTPQVRIEEIKQTGLLTRINYVYDNKYSFTGSLRRDGDSRFNKDNRYRTFPSAAFAWTISEEGFMDWATDLDNWKIRMSAGKAGNSGQRPRDTRESFVDFAYSFGGNYEIGAGSRALVDEELTWQSTIQYDIGTDISLFNSRLQLVGDIYLKQTEDMILDQPMAPNTGYSLYRTNAGDLDNWGYELTINSNNIVTKNFVWSSTFTFAADRSEVLSLNGPTQQFFKDRLTGGNSVVLAVGENIGTWVGYDMDGVYNTWAEIEASPITKNLRGDDLQPGDPKYVDQDGDNRINENDLTIIADTQPQFHGGLYNNFKYKNFDFSLFFTYKYNMDVINGDKLKHSYHSRGGGNTMFSSALYNAWSPDNPNSEHPGFHLDEGSSTLPLSSYHIEDGSFIRLQNVSFAYNIPKKLFEGTFINTCKLSFNITNVYLWTDYTGSDPENSVSRGRNSNLAPNLDWGTYPRARTWNTTLKLGF